MKKVQLIWLGILIILLGGITAYAFGSKEPVEEVVNLEAAPVREELFTEADINSAYQDAVFINADVDKVSIEGEGAAYLEEERIIEISKAGTYALGGTLDQGMVRISVYDDETVHLILNNIRVSSAGGPALYVKSAGKVIITANENTENIFGDTAYNTKYPEEAACIYSSSDLSFNGTGAIGVWGYYEDAIASKGIIKIADGRLFLWAVDDGIRGREGVFIQNGYFNIQTEATAIKTTQSGNPEKGNVVITGGDLELISGEHAIESAGNIEASGATFNVQTIWEEFSALGTIFIDEDCMNGNENE